jgi:hypothetical protein
VRRSDLPTMPAGDRAWFVRKTKAGTIEWGLIKPFADGSALLRTNTDFKTCAPPNGPREALAHLDKEGYVSMEIGKSKGLIGDDEPPKW